MSTAFSDLNENIYSVLSNDTAFADLIPIANIRPSFDPLEMDRGNLASYGWANSSWDKRSRRGTGVLNFVIGSVDNKDEANQALGLLRNLMDERTLSDVANSKVVVHLIAEEPVTSDEGRDQTGRFAVSAQFRVKLVEAP